MNRCLMKIVPGIGGVLAAAVLLLAACGGGPAAQPAASPSAPATPPATPKGDSAALRAKGEDLFQKTAGGVGCQMCHGADGKGKPNIAPAIRGKTADDIKRALGLDAMSFIRLTDDDIQAVAEYLKYLQSQP